MHLNNKKIIIADGTKDLKMSLQKVMKSLQDSHLCLYIFLMVIKKFVITKPQQNNSLNQPMKMHLTHFVCTGNSLISINL